MAADFNLSAAISLQLAQGAIAKLRDDIQKGFSSSLELDTSKVNKKIGDVKKDVKKDPIKVPITFITKAAEDLYADIKKKLKPFPIDVEFSDKSVKDNLTKKKLLEILGNKAIVIPIEVEYGTGAKAELEKIIKATEKLQKEQKRLNDLKSKSVEGERIGGGGGGGGKKPPKKTFLDQSDNVGELITQTGQLARLNSSLFKGGSKAYGGGFFKFANEQLKALETQIKRILINNDKLRHRFKDSKGFLDEKFAGLSGDTTGNATASLRALYSAYGELDSQQKNLIKNQKKFGNNFDIKSQIDQINQAKEAIAEMFVTYDSADPASFKTGLNSQLKETRDLASDTKREMKSFAGLISNLNQKKAGITEAGGSPQSQKNIDAVIAKAKSLQATGATTEQIRADAGFQRLSALARVLDYVDIAAQRAGSSIAAAVSKVNKGELKDTFGGRAVGLLKNVNRIGAKGEAAASAATSPKEVSKIQSDTAQEIQSTVQKAGDVQKQYQRIRTEIINLEKGNFDGPAKSLRTFTIEIYRLARAGASIDNIDVLVSKKLAEVANTVGLEKKVNSAVNQIGKLRNALEFSPTTDISGAGKMLDRLEDDLKARVGKFKDLTQDKLTQGISSGTFDVRALQRFNEAAGATSQKLRDIGYANENLAVGKIYTKNADEFDRAAEKIASGSQSIGQKLQELKRTSDKVLINTKFDAEGGFFGSVSKSAGLATKRLAAFLVMAQGLYTVQSLLSASLQEAIKIDREFIKLEQVLNKEFSGTALEKSLGGLKKQIFSLGKDLGVSASEIADAAQILAQAGVTGKDLQTLLGTVAKSQLGPTFDKASETAEAAIAIFQQFNLTAKQTQDALGGINRLSAKYAVEAKGITEAVRRAGGIFSSSGDDISSFASAFTLVKEQTREADEAIATGLRNVAQRLQSSTTQKKLREALGINLVENGEFVGFEESIKRIGLALQNLGAGEKSPLFSQIREIIGGARQGGRITPLLQNFERFAELNEEFGKGAKSIEEDVAVAFNSIENKIQRAKTAATDLFHEIISSKMVKVLVEGFVQITTFATNLLKTLNSIPGAILAIGVAAKIIGKSGFIAQAALSQIIPRTTVFEKKNKGGPIGFNAGGGSDGFIPGRGPNKDSLLAYLTKGEYVIKRGSVDKYGKDFFDMANAGTLPANKGGIARNGGGIIPGYNTGGLFDLLKKAGFNLKPEDLSGLVTKFTTGAAANLPGTTRGSSNVAEKSIKLLDPKGLTTLAHEFGHIITATFNKSTAVKIFEDLPNELKQTTRARVLSKPETYGAEGSAKFGRSIQRETLADAVKELAGRSARKSSLANKYSENEGFSALEQSTFEKTGISFRQRKNSGNLNIPSINKAPESFGSFYGEDPKSTFGDSNIQNALGKFKPTSAPGGLGHPGSIQRNVTKNVSKLSGGTLPKLSGGGIGSLLPKGALLSFGKDLVTTKGGIISLVTAFATLQGVLGQFGDGLTGLVTAMAAAAFSMYTFSSVGTAIAGAQKKMGLLGKSIIAGKGEDLAKSFASSDAGKGKLARAADLKLLRTAPGVGPKVNAVGEALSTKDILARVRSKAPLDAAQKSALAASNSAARSGAAKAAQASAQSGIGGKLAGLGKFGGAAKGLAGKLNVAGIAVGLITGALTYFADSAEESANLALENATTLKEAQAAGSKKRLAGSLKTPISAVGNIAKGALAGASVGSAVPVVGTAIGAVAGAIAGGIYTFSDQIGNILNNILPKSVVDFGSSVASGIGNLKDTMISSISDMAYTFSQNLQHGSWSDIFESGFRLSGIGLGLEAAGIKGSGDSYGDKKLALAKDQESRDFRVGRIKNRLGDKSNKATQESLQNKDLEDLLINTQTAKGVLEAGKNKVGQDELKGENPYFSKKTGRKEFRQGAFKDLSVEAQDSVKTQLQGVADVFNASGPKNQALISKMYDDMGIDIVALANEVGVTLDKTKAEAAAAFNKLNLFFAEMGKNVEFAGARASGLEGGLSMFSDTSASSRAFAPDQLLDILGQGIDPKTLGLGSTFDQSLSNTAALTQAFDPRLKAAADFDVKGKRASRSAADGIIKAGNQGLSLNNTDAPTIASFLQNSFNAASGNDDQMGKKFAEFLKSKGDEFLKSNGEEGSIVDVEGNVNASIVSDLFKEFGDKFSSGALEEIKRITNLSKQYSQQYKQQLAERFALEGEIIGLLQSNIGKRKQLNDVNNKAKGLVGDKLAAEEGKQAAQSTFATKEALLTNTGFGGNSTTQQLTAGLVASQQRQANASQVARNELGPGAGVGAMTTRTAEIEGVEIERQKRIKDALTYTAGGTDTFTHAMAEFERAAQKAAASSQALSNSLLGTDSEMMSTMLGVQALHKINAAYQQGGTAAGSAALYTLGEDERQAIQTRIGSDPELQAQFNQSVGIGNDISASREAGNVRAGLQDQANANNGLITGLDDLKTNLSKNTSDMQKFYEAQFNNTQQIIQQAENTAKNLVDQIANLPEVIKHDVNIVMNIVGADVFNALDPAITKIVTAQVRAALDDYGNKLVANNAGLNRPK